MMRKSSSDDCLALVGDAFIVIGFTSNSSRVSLTSELAAACPRFDRERFLRACGVSS
jgi:hypothetical protein